MLRDSPPPGEQANYERWSLVFFTRPGDSVVLKALSEESDTIAQEVARTPDKMHDTGVTSKEWFTRRIKNQRLANRTVCCISLQAFHLHGNRCPRVPKPGWLAEVLSTTLLLVK
jgi:hypothetical protein